VFKGYAKILNEFEAPLRTLSDDQRSLVVYFLKRYLPCPEPTHFNATLQLFRRIESDCYPKKVAEALESVYQALLSQPLTFDSTHYASHYPVAASLSALNTALNKNEAITDTIKHEAIELYLDLCGAGSEAHLAETFSDSQLTTHIRALRDCIEYCLESPQAIAELEHTSLRLLFSRIVQSENKDDFIHFSYAGDRKKLKLLTEIFGIEPSRYFGCTLKTSQEQSSDSDAIAPATLRVVSAHELLTRQRHKNSTQLDAPLTEAIPKHTTPKARKKRTERKQITIVLPYFASATGGDLVCDSGARSLKQIGAWLDYLAGIDTRVMLGCLISFTTGLRLSRLTRLRCSTDRITGPNVHLDLNTSTLRYAVERYRPTGMPVKTGEVPLNHIVQLPIPQEWTDRLLEDKSPLPFKNLIDDYNRIRNRKPPSDLTKLPRTQTWSLSTPEFDQDLFTTIESGVKSGRMEAVHSAPAAYQQLDPNRLSQKFNTALRSMIFQFSALDLSQLFNSGLLASTNGIWIDPIHFTGSKFAIDPIPVLTAFTTAVFKKRHQLIRALNRSAEVDKLNLLVDFANLQQVYFYMLLQALSLGRPIGKKSDIAISPLGIWVRDKASRLYNERKVIPWSGPDGSMLADFALNQAQTNQSMSDRLLNRATVFGLQRSKINLPSSLVGFYTLEPEKHALILSPATFRVFRNQLQHFSLDHLLPIKGNFLRHYFATTWASIHHDCTLYEALGHKHDRREVWGEESSATPAMLQWVASAQYKLLMDTQFRPFNNPSTDNGR